MTQRILYRWRPVLATQYVTSFQELMRIQEHFIDLLPEPAHDDEGVNMMYKYFRLVIISVMARVDVVDDVTKRLREIQDELWSDANTRVWLRERVETQLAMLFVLVENYLYSGKTEDDFVSLYSSILGLFVW